MAERAEATVNVMTPPTKSPRLVLVGAAGFTNLGDDAILAAMLAELRVACPGAHFTVATGDPAAFAGDPTLGGADVRLIPFADEAIAAALADADLLIVGGGGFIYDHDARISAHNFLHGDTSLFYPHFRALVVAHALGVPSQVYGIGVGPLVTAAGRGLTRTILGLAGAITVRDPLSLLELRAAGLDRADLAVTADPALGLPPVAPTATEPAGRVVGFVARGWLQQGGGWTTPGAARHERYLDWLATGADYAVERWDATPLFLPLQRRYDDDSASAARVIARMRHGARARIAAGLIGYRDLQIALAGLDALVSTRLHPLILGCAAGVPPIGIALSPKVRAFLGGLGLGELALSPWLARDADLRAALDRALSTPAPIRATLSAGLTAQRSAAARNPQLAATLLRRATGRIGA
jgi:polysaccharide pyruvyl transferase WcaK-like protein